MSSQQSLVNATVPSSGYCPSSSQRLRFIMETRSQFDRGPSLRRAVRRFTGVAAFLGTLVVAGCSFGAGDGSGTVGGDTASFAEQVNAALESAVARGAGDDQLAILRDAQVTGEVTFDQARQAVLATIDCIEGGGGSASYYELSESSGLVVPSAILEAKDPDGLTRMEPVLDECVSIESFWVNKVYQLQPDSQEVRDAYLEKQAPAIRECLEDNGYATDPEASPQELVMQSSQVSAETSNAIKCYG